MKVRISAYSSFIMARLNCYRLADETPRVRLLACHRSGTVRAFTLVQSSSRTWSVAEDIQKLDGSEHPLPRGTFVIGARNGASRAATRQTFSEALQGRTNSPRSKDEKGIHCFWISAGEKSVKCTANFTGNRIGKTEWGKGRKVECVEVINRSGKFIRTSFSFGVELFPQVRKRSLQSWTQEKF